jgi:Zn-dependent protease with chaperone function
VIPGNGLNAQPHTVDIILTPEDNERLANLCGAFDTHLRQVERREELTPGDVEVLEVANRATQHLYIVNPIKSFEERAASLWDTHPPIGERVRALEAIAGRLGASSGG